MIQILIIIYKIKNIYNKKYDELLEYFVTKKVKYNCIYHNLFIVLMYICGSYFYILSLTHVEGFEMRCFSKFGIQCFYKLSKLTFTSGIFISLALYYMIHLSL